MLAVLKLEYIGEDRDAYARIQGISGYRPVKPWVAQITGYDEENYTFIREFAQAQIDYSQANSKGSRGVYLYFPLKDGIYEVKERLTHAKERRYFISIEQAKITEISKKEVEQMFLPEISW